MLEDVKGNANIYMVCQYILYMVCQYIWTIKENQYIILYIYLEQTKKDHKTRSKSQDGRKGKVGKAKIDRARKVTVAKHGTQERRE